MILKPLVGFGLVLFSLSTFAKEVYVQAPAFLTYSVDGQSQITKEDLSENQIQDLKRQGYLVEAPVTFRIAGWVDKGPRIDATWAADAMEVPRAHKLAGTHGDGVKVCIVDTGVDRSHSMLKSKIVATGSFISGETVNDGHGHGTHVASLVAGSTDLGSAAPGARLIIAKGLNNHGSGEQSSLTRAIDFCIAQGAKVINMSLSSDTGSGFIKAAVDRALAKGIIVVAAAGNTGGGIRYPANYPGVISVGATTSGGSIAGFSCRGSGLDFVAPGAGILGARAGGGQITMSGTSMAAPFVAGMMAMRIAKGKSALKTKSLGLSSSLQGRGQVNAYLTATGN